MSYNHAPYDFLARQTSGGPAELPCLDPLESPLHCVNDIVPGRPVHTYDQKGGIRWNSTVTPALQALRHSISWATVLRLWVGKLDDFLVTLKGIEPLVSALRVLHFNGCEILRTPTRSNSVHLLIPILLQACTLQTLTIDSSQRSVRSRHWCNGMNQAVLFGWLSTQACRELSDPSFINLVHGCPLSGFEMRRVTRGEWRFQPLVSVFVGPQDVDGMQRSYRLIGRSFNQLAD